MRDLENGLREHFFARVARDAAEGFVDAQVSSGGIDFGDADAGMLLGGLEALLAFAQGLAGPHDLVDVGRSAEPAGDPAILAQDRCSRLEPMVRTVEPAHAEIGILGHLAPHRPGPGR